MRKNQPTCEKSLDTPLQKETQNIEIRLENVAASQIYIKNENEYLLAFE